MYIEGGEIYEQDQKSGDSRHNSRITELVKSINKEDQEWILNVFDALKKKLKTNSQILEKINYGRILDQYKGKKSFEGTYELGPFKLVGFIKTINYLEGGEDIIYTRETKDYFEQFRNIWNDVKSGRETPDNFITKRLDAEKERDKYRNATWLLKKHFGEKVEGIDATKRQGEKISFLLKAIKENTGEVGLIYKKLLEGSMTSEDWNILDAFVKENKEALRVGSMISSSGEKELKDLDDNKTGLDVQNNQRILGLIASKYNLQWEIGNDLRNTLIFLDGGEDLSEINDIKSNNKGFENFIDNYIDALKNWRKNTDRIKSMVERFLSDMHAFSIDRKGGLYSLYTKTIARNREILNDRAVKGGDEFVPEMEEIYKNWKKERIGELMSIDLGEYAYNIAFGGKDGVDITSLFDVEIGDIKLSEYSRNEYITATILKYKKTKSPDALQALGYFAKRSFPGRENEIQIGTRGEGVASFLNHLRRDPNFSEYASDIEGILKQHYPSGNYPEWKDYISTSETENEIIREYEKSVEKLRQLGVTLDSQEVQRALYGVRPHARPGLFPYSNQIPRTPEEYQTKHRFDFIEQNTEKRFIASVKDLSDDRVESIIPEEEYLYGIKLKGKLENQGGGLIDFLGNCKDLPDIYKRSPGNIILAKAIMNSKNTSLSIEGVDQSLLDQIKADWFNWGCKGLIESYKRHLGIHINFFAGETALGVREGMLNSILKDKLHFEVKDIPNPHPDKIDRDIFYFTDTGNSAYRENPYYPVYGFNPKTGEIFIEKQGINKEAGKISLGEGGVIREKIANIPPYSIFMGRISVNDILPNTRPSSYEESVENLTDEISNKMTFAFSEVKGKEIEENLLQSRYKGEILDKAKSMLGITENMNEIMEDQPARYQILTTIVNTVENISSEDMNELNVFFDNIKQYYGKNEGMQNMKSNPSIFSYFSMYANSSDLSKEGWESESFEKNRVFREGSGKTPLKPSETKLGKFFSFLYKRKGENPNFNNIDQTLTSDLITKDDLEKRVLDIGKIRYLNQNMSKDIGNISGTTQLEQWGKYMKKTLYAPYELDAIETEIQGIPD